MQNNRMPQYHGSPPRYYLDSQTPTNTIHNLMLHPNHNMFVSQNNRPIIKDESYFKSAPGVLRILIAVRIILKSHY